MLVQFSFLNAKIIKRQFNMYQLSHNSTVFTEPKLSQFMQYSDNLPLTILGRVLISFYEAN
jgi:hypothetical protein